MAASLECRLDKAGFEDFIADLKNDLDGEMRANVECKHMTELLTAQLEKITGGTEISRDVRLPSDLITFLEDNMPRSELLPCLYHVFNLIHFHRLSDSLSYADVILKFLDKRKDFKCPDVVGREQDLSSLNHILSQPQCAGVWLHGPGGIGKTTCARELCRRCHYDGHNVRIIDLQTVTSAGDLLMCLAEALYRRPETEQQPITEILLKDVLYRLQTCSNNILLMLDNTDNISKETYEILLVMFKCETRIKWIITSRLPPEERMPSVETYAIEPLSDEHAATLMRDLCKPRKLSSDDVKLLNAITGNSPYALKLISNEVRHFPGQRLTEEILGPSVQRGMNPIINHVMQSLDPCTQRHVLTLSILRDTMFDIECVSDMCDTPEPVLLMALLKHRQIIQSEVGSTKDRLSYLYSFHPLILTYLQANRTAHQVLLDEARVSLCKHVRKVILRNATDFDINFKSAVNETIQNNDRLLKVFYSVLETDAFDIRKFQLSFEEVRYLIHLYHRLVISYPEKLRFFQKINEKAIETQLRYLFRREILVVKQYVISKDNLKTTIDTADRYLTSLYMEHLPDEQKQRIEAGLLYEKGRSLRKLQRLNNECALQCFEKALSLYEAIKSHTDVQMDIALVQNAIGNVHFDNQKIDKAYNMQAAALATAYDYIGHDVHPWVTLYEFNLGTAHVEKAEQLFQRDRATSSDHFNKALAIFENTMARDKELGNDRLPEFADKLSYKAKVLERLRRYDDAYAVRKEANDLLEFIYTNGEPKKTSAYVKIACCIMKWSREFASGTEESRSRVREALEYFEKAEKETINGFPPTEDVKRDYLHWYKRSTDSVKMDRKEQILAFCERYEDNRSFDSDDESSDSDIPSSESSEDSDYMDMTKRASTTSDCDMKFDELELECGEHVFSASDESDNEAERSLRGYLHKFGNSHQNSNEPRNGDNKLHKANECKEDRVSQFHMEPCTLRPTKRKLSEGSD